MRTKRSAVSMAVAVNERLACLVEIPAGLGPHKSMPSRRTSCISGCGQGSHDRLGDG